MEAPTAKNEISTPAQQRKSLTKARGLKEADREVDFFFIFLRCREAAYPAFDLGRKSADFQECAIG
jgi:hypothetical protein